MNVPLKEYLEAVATETARMSYPGRMSPILHGGAKAKAEEYFKKKFPIAEVWGKTRAVARSFDKWHSQWTKELAHALEKKVDKRRGYKPKAVATKLINTFLHQLMKYKRCQPLYKKLHLPLDEEVFKALRRIWNKDRPETLRPIEKFFRGKGSRSPYKLEYAEYKKIQEALGWLVVKSRVSRKKLNSRIELNALLWAQRL